MTDATLKTIITADSSKFLKAVAEAQNSAQSFSMSVGKSMRDVGIAFASVSFAAQQVVKALFSAADSIGKLTDDAAQIGVATQSLQNMSVAAGLVGVTTEEIVSSITKMNKRVAEAALEGGGAAKAFTALGLTLGQLQTMAPEDQFLLIGERIRQVGDIQNQTKISMDVFGKTSAGMLQLFNVGLVKSIGSAEKLGLTLEDSQVAALDALSDTKDMLKTIWDAFLAKTTAELAPTLQEVLKDINKTIEGMGGIGGAAKRAAANIKSAFSIIKDVIDPLLKAVKKLDDMLTKIGIGAKDPIPLRVTDDDAKRYASNKSKADGTINYADVAEKQKSLQAATQQSIAIARVTNAYAEQEKATKLVVDSLKEMKNKALESASALDRNNAFKNKFAEAGREQSNDIIAKAVDANKQKLASSPFFQTDVNSIVRDIQNGYYEAAANAIKSLEIGVGKNDNASKTTNIMPSMTMNGKTTFFPELAEQARRNSTAGVDGKDYSGMREVVDQLKGFLGSKTLKQQEVQVKIQVSPTKDFVTTITQESSFREAVSKEFDEKIAQAARGTAP